MNNDLISRSALCGKQEEMYIHTDSGKIIPAMAIPVWVINNAPAVDAEPVRHGRWIPQDVTFTRFMCSACKSRNHAYRTDYCPNCGAKMDLKEDEDG